MSRRRHSVGSVQLCPNSAVPAICAGIAFAGFTVALAIELVKKRQSAPDGADSVTLLLALLLTALISTSLFSVGVLGIRYKRRHRSATSGEVRYRPRGIAPLLAIWGFAFALELFALLFASTGLFDDDPSAGKWIFLAFPVAGAAVFPIAILKTFRYRRYGRSELILAEPPRVGGIVGGVVCIRGASADLREVSLVLQCTALIYQGKHVREETLWHEEAITEIQPERWQGNQVLELSFKFEVPPDLPVTLDPGYRDGIQWLLWVGGETSGPNLDLEFLLDVRA